ncbi:hypothetical protein L150_03976, partial [Candida albicans Ca529L]
SGDDNCLGSG